jgi:hypothetical protein
MGELGATPCLFECCKSLALHNWMLSMSNCSGWRWWHDDGVTARDQRDGWDSEVAAGESKLP